MAGPRGGLLDGVRLRVAAGVLNQQTTITLSLGDSAALASALAAKVLGGTIVGTVIRLSTSAGTAFPATLTIPYSPGGLGTNNPYSILVFRRGDTGGLSAVGDTVDTESPPYIVDIANHTITLTIKGFSTFSAVVPRSPIQERVKGTANVGCETSPGQVTAKVIDDQVVLGLTPRTAPVSLIVLHSTASGAGQSLDDVLRWGYENDGCTPFACQAHYYIGRAGEVLRLVDEGWKAFHAVDRRQQQVYANANNLSIGIELFQREPAGTPLDNPPFTDEQYLSLRYLLAGLRERHPAAIVDYHKVLDPTRRHDPTAFDPARLTSLETCAPIYAASGSGTNSSPSSLWIVTPTSTGTDNLIGRIRTIGGSEPVITDIARTADGTLWGTSFDALWEIDRTSGRATLFGTYNNLSDANALAFDAGGRLFIAGESGLLGVIDIQQRNLTILGSFGSGYGSWGDLAFSPDGILYAAVKTSAGEGVLVRVNQVTGLASRVSTSAIGFGNVWGLAFVAGTLYGLTADPLTGHGSLISINRSTGIGTFVRQLAFSAFGGGAPRP